MSTDAQNETQLPDDLNVPKSTEHKAADGKVIKIHSLKTGGLLRLIGALRTSRITSYPETISPLEFLTTEQRAELRSIGDNQELFLKTLGEMLGGLSGEQKFLIQQSKREFSEAMMNLICESEVLFPIAIAAVSDVTEPGVADLDPIDTIAILDKALDLTDWERLQAAGKRFFPRLGALVKTATRKPENKTAAASVESK